MNSKKNKCPICGGRKTKGTTVYSVDLDKCLVVVRNVAAEICEQCGEEWIDNETAQELEQITNEAFAKRHQVEIVAMKGCI